jgi:hypothetical protein
MSLEKPQAFVLFDILTSKLTGKTPEFGPVKRVRLAGRGRRAAAPASRSRKKAPGRNRARRRKA